MIGTCEVLYRNSTERSELEDASTMEKISIRDAGINTNEIREMLCAR